jgi:hypothetical protein
MKRGWGWENWRRNLQNSEILKHPVVEVSTGGTVAGERPSEFKLATQAGFHSVTARLLYPADSETGNIGDEVTASLAEGDKTDLYFTGKTYSANFHGKYREPRLTDSYKKLCDTVFTAAYRKEKAANILDDILGAAGITEKSVACSGVELARFSTQTVTARLCADLLIDALKEHGVEKNKLFFFDEKDTFHFGTGADTGRNEGAEYVFETGKNILKTGSGWIEVLPRPIRHTRESAVNGKAMLTVRSDLTVSRKLSRLTLWLGEAA